MKYQAIDRPHTGSSDNQCLDLDEEIRARVRYALAKSAYYSVRRIDCSMQGGMLTLSGRVPSYYLKQVAQIAAIEVLNPPTRIDNRLEVGIES
jgi:hypothetical protein